MSAASNAPIRLFESDLTPKVASVVFNGNEYQMQMQITAYGDFTVQATNWTGLLISKKARKPAIDHYGGIVGKHPELEHQNMQLRDHIQVKQCFS